MKVDVVCFFNQIKMQKLPLSDLKDTDCKITLSKITQFAMLLSQKSNYKIILADNTKSQKLEKTYFLPDLLKR